MKLNETIGMMSSSDYKERFVAEYWQTKIRYEKLKDFCNRIEVSDDYEYYEREPDHDCPYELLRKQQKAMGEYLHVLELRAIIENIDLSIYQC